MSMNSSKRFLWSPWPMMSCWLIFFVSSHLLALAEDSKELENLFRDYDPANSLDENLIDRNFAAMHLGKTARLCGEQLMGVCKPPSQCNQYTTSLSCKSDGKQDHVCCTEQNLEFGAPPYKEDEQNMDVTESDRYAEIYEKLLQIADEIKSQRMGHVSDEKQSKREAWVPLGVQELRNDHDYPGCGIRPSSTEIKSDDAEKDEQGWPWLVSISIRQPTGLKLHLCSGTFISKRYVLSAARCFNNTYSRPPVSDYIVTIGTHVNLSYRDTSKFKNKKMVAGREYKVRRIIVHQDYQENYHYNDIAMLVLVKNVKLTTYAVPICLPYGPVQFPDDNDISAIAIGWDQLPQDAENPRMPRQVETQIVPFHRCQTLVPKHSALPRGIKGDMVCATVIDGMKDSCPDDTGGPLVVARKDNRWVMAGIVSFGMDAACRNVSKPSMHTRITSFIPWILIHIKISETYRRHD